MAATRVLLLAGDPLARGGLAALLAAEPLVEVVGQGRLDELPALLAAGPDVVCWDANDEVDEAAGLLEAARDVPVLALAGPHAGAPALWRAGIRAVVDRRAPAGTLAAALHAAAAGLEVIDRPAGGDFLRADPAAPADGPDALTPREREVLSLLAEGLGNRAIAARLGLSEHTAKFHVNAILGKLGAATRAEAIVLAVRRGLIAL